MLGLPPQPPAQTYLGKLAELFPAVVFFGRGSREVGVGTWHLFLPKVKST